MRYFYLVFLFTTLWGACGMAANSLTPSGLQDELVGDRWGDEALNDRGWGLLPPIVAKPIYEIQGQGVTAHALMTQLPAQARVEEGRLFFELRGGKALLGIGNCEKQLPIAERPDFGQRFDVEITFDQIGPGVTEWLLVPWSDGHRTKLSELADKYTASAKQRGVNVEEDLQNRLYNYCRRKVEGAQQHVIRINDTGAFYRRGWMEGKSPFDGFDLEIKGEPGIGIVLHSIRIFEKTRAGGFRKEFCLPSGAVWRAAGSISRRAYLFVNGKEVPSTSPLAPRPLGVLQEIDLKPYLQPGTNVLAVYPAFTEYADAFLMASVVMESGEMLDLSTNPEWLYISDRGPGWDLPGYQGATEAITNCRSKSTSSLGAKLSAHQYGYRLDLREGKLPAYEGLLLFTAPDDDQLYYSAGDYFCVKACCPAGLAARQPAVEWLLCRYNQGGALDQFAAGHCAGFKVENDSLVFELADSNAQKLEQGVYVLKTVLRDASGAVIEDRIPEAVIVTGQIPMRKTAGLTFEDGLDLEEESVLDLTRPDDPNWPWMEIDGKQVCETPIVVTRNGLAYRETRPLSSTYDTQVLISYNYAFKHPGDFYLMELEYPDDQPRFFGVNLCSEHDGPGDHSKAGPSVWTGVNHLNSGKMQRLQWLFRPDYGYTSINLTNMLAGSTAAASKLRIARVKGRLPELDVAGNARRFGVLTESAEAVSGFGKTFRARKAARKSADAPDAASPLLGYLENFNAWLDTCGRYVEYQRWAGQNLIFMAFFQYSGNRQNAEAVSPNGDSRVVRSMADLAARVFRNNGIDFFASIEYMSTADLESKYGEKRVDLRESPFRIDGQGREGRVFRGGYNVNHAEVRRSITSVALEAARKFKRLPNFRGVNFITSLPGGMAPDHFLDDGPGQASNYNFRRGALDPLRFDYSDATIRRFEQALGRKLPIDDQSAERFQERYRLLTSEAMREKWIAWRAQNLLEFFLEVRDQLRAIKPDALVCLGSISPAFFADYATAYGASLEGTMRLFGWDYALYNRQLGLCAVPWLQTGRYSFSGRFSGNSRDYENYLKRLRLNVEPAFLKIGDGDTARIGMADYCWLELERGAQRLLPKREGWQVPYQYTMEGSEQGEAARRPFIQALAGTDFDTLLFGFTDVNMTIGNEQPLREFMRFFRALPQERFEFVPGDNQELIVRALKKDRQFIFYVLNPAPWPVDVKVLVKTKGAARNMITGEPCPTPIQTKISGYQGAAFAIEGEAEMLGWETKGAGELFARYLAHMREQAQKMKSWLAHSELVSVLAADDRSTMETLVSRAQTALDGEHPAQAWRIMNEWPFTWHAYALERQNAMLALYTESDPAPAELGRKTMLARRIAAPPTIDGQLDEKVWKEHEAQVGFIDQEGNPSRLGTKAWAAWDDEFLYLAFDCRDNFPDQLKATAREEREIMKDDCMVFLLQPDLKKKRHYQMAVNSAGSKFDQRDYDYNFAPEWRAVAQRGEKNWTVEIALPWKELGVEPPVADAQWGVNFCRIFRQNKLPWSAWNYMPTDWHNPANYGVLTFTGE